MQKDAFRRQAHILRVLSNPVRLEILAAVLFRQVCVKNLTELLGRRQPNISQHLSILRQSGIIECQRKGKMVCYHLSQKK